MDFADLRISSYSVAFCHIGTTCILPRTCYSCHVKACLLLYWLHNKQVTKGLTISDPSDASFSVIRLAGTAMLEAVVAVSEGCCLWNYRCDNPEDRKQNSSFCSIVISFCAVSTRIDIDCATVMKCVLINSHHYHACCILQMSANVLEEPAASIIKVGVYHLQDYGVITQRPTI